MIKNENIIIDNFFGISYDYQVLIYDLLFDSLSKEDTDLKNNLINTFKDYFEDINSLNEIYRKGISLNNRYTDKILKDNMSSINDYMNDDSNKVNDYLTNFFNNFKSNDLNILEKINKVFNTKKVENYLVNDFIRSYYNTPYEEKKEFIEKFIKNNYILTYLLPEYIPGNNVMDEQLDNLILHLFNDEIYDEYKKLDSIRKLDFIFKFHDEILSYYDNQNRVFSLKRVFSRKN